MGKSKPFLLLGNTILPGKTERIYIEIAKLQTNTPIQIPIIVSHAKKPGPTLLLIGGVHGDEINGVEIIRRIIRKKYHQPKFGTVICIPLLNIFGFLNHTREFPDGRDLNRVFPGSKSGSLASQYAYMFTKEIAPLADVVIDFHTGGSQRSNYPQTRCDFNNEGSLELCKVFAAPYLIHSPVIPKSIRSTCTKMGTKYILYEGGKSHYIDNFIVESAIEGTKRVMTEVGLRRFERKDKDQKSTIIKESRWIRASNSGMLNLSVENGSFVEKGKILAKISDPYGKIERSVKAPFDGVIFNVNETPLINKGDALFNIGKPVKS